MEIPSPRTSNGLTALDPPCARTLSLKMSFLPHGKPLGDTGSLMLGVTHLEPSMQQCNTYQLLDVNKFGWRVVEGCLEIDWDDPRNTEQVKESVRLLLRGCKCKKGYNNRRCSCFKSGIKCGPGCRCANCENLPSSRSQPDKPYKNVEQQEL